MCLLHILSHGYSLRYESYQKFAKVKDRLNDLNIVFFTEVINM